MESPESKNEWFDVENEIALLFDADQNEPIRKGLVNSDEAMQTRDEDRLIRAKQILKAYQEKVFELSGQDLWKLGCIFQHGRVAENYKIAFELAQQAIDKGYVEATDLLHAAEDRFLLETTEKQKWGTQTLEEGE
ncbi:MAG: hypothetical protein K0S38_678 [Candidatus Paceibacter sp.]|jgi:hypothetical protein|nr:hypothetical protein [Candidatus Paceibacter sp.]